MRGSHSLLKRAEEASLARILEQRIMRRTPKQTLICKAACLSLFLGCADLFALDHNDGTSPAQDISATKIQMMVPSKTILGQDFKYPTGVPLIESFRIEIPPGKETSLHKHAVPMYVYLTSGELEVDYGSKGKRTFKAGSSYVEALNWCHFGRAVGNQPVQLLAVYLGQQDPNQVAPESCLKPE